MKTLYLIAVAAMFAACQPKSTYDLVDEITLCSRDSVILDRGGYDPLNFEFKTRNEFVAWVNDGKYIESAFIGNTYIDVIDLESKEVVDSCRVVVTASEISIYDLPMLDFTANMDDVFKYEKKLGYSPTQSINKEDNHGSVESIRVMSMYNYTQDDNNLFYGFNKNNQLRSIAMLCPFNFDNQPDGFVNDLIKLHGGLPAVNIDDHPEILSHIIVLLYNGESYDTFMKKCITLSLGKYQDSSLKDNMCLSVSSVVGKTVLWYFRAQDTGNFLNNELLEH